MKIMGRTLPSLVLALASAIVALLILPAAVGLQLQRQFVEQAFLADRSSGLLTAQVRGFERGWFASQMLLEVDFGGPGQQAPVLLSSRVQHGPVGFQGGFFWGLFRAVTVPEPDNPQLVELARAANLPHLFELRSTAGFGGGGEFELQVPPVQATAASLGEPDAPGAIDFSGMQLHGNWSANGEQWRLRGGFATLQLVGDTAQLRLSGMSLEATARALTDHLWLGPTTLRLDAIDLGAPGESVSLSGEELALLIGSSGLPGASTTDLTATLRADRIALSETVLSAAQITVALPSVPVPALDRYLQTFDGGALRAELAAAAPVATFQPIAFSIARDAFAAKLQVSLNDGQPPPPAVLASSDVGRWLAHLHIEGALQVAAPLAAKMAGLGAPLQLPGLVEQGLLRVSGDGYAAALVLHRGSLQVNEQVVPLAELLQ